MPDWDEAEHGPRFSTEWHVGESLRLLGHDLVRINEDRDDWATTIKACTDADLLIWTATRDYSLRWDQHEAAEAVFVLNEMLPTVIVHLDKWWGLDREPHIFEDVYWELRYAFTADGDHDDRWAEAGVRHFWMPPAVFGPECVPGTARVDWASDIAFIGSWQSYAHQEHWPARRRMLAFAKERWGEACQFWPRAGKGAVRSRNLNDLLASVKVVLGDSCRADISTRYFSDRIFETVGRGGFCVHPRIEGLAELLPDGMGVAYYPPGDLEEMARLVDWWVAHDSEREVARAAGQAFVRDHHTYSHRMQDVLDTLHAEGAWA